MVEMRLKRLGREIRTSVMAGRYADNCSIKKKTCFPEVRTGLTDYGVSRMPGVLFIFRTEMDGVSGTIRASSSDSSIRMVWETGDSAG